MGGGERGQAVARGGGAACTMVARIRFIRLISPELPPEIQRAIVIYAHLSCFLAIFDTNPSSFRLTRTHNSNCKRQKTPENMIRSAIVALILALSAPSGSAFSNAALRTVSV